MKAGYFTLDNIAAKARRMLEEIPVKRGLAGSGFDPTQAALIILDMQKYFLDPGSDAFVPSAPATLPGILSLAAAFKKQNQPVVLTRHLNTPENSGVMADWGSDLIREDDPASEIIADLLPHQSFQVRKSQYDAFLGTELRERLAQSGVTQVVIAGVLTHLCCETTARGAFMRGFKVFFPVDGTSTYYEDFHRAALLNLSHGFAVPVLVEEINTMLTS